MPDLSGLVPRSAFFAQSIDYGTTTSAWQGFDVTEHFAVRVTATLLIQTAGVYYFVLGSDDGSLLYIDGQKVVDNDLTHQYIEKFGAKNLQSGFHSIEVCKCC